MNHDNVLAVGETRLSNSDAYPPTAGITWWWYIAKLLPQYLCMAAFIFTLRESNLFLLSSFFYHVVKKEEGFFRVEVSMISIISMPWKYTHGYPWVYAISIDHGCPLEYLFWNEWILPWTLHGYFNPGSPTPFGEVRWFSMVWNCFPLCITIPWYTCFFWSLVFFIFACLLFLFHSDGFLALTLNLHCQTCPCLRVKMRIHIRRDSFKLGLKNDY